MCFGNTENLEENNGTKEIGLVTPTPGVYRNNGNYSVTGLIWY